MGEWNPAGGVRLAPAWRAVIVLLADGKPHAYSDVVTRAREASAVNHERGIPRMLRAAVKLGLLWRDIDFANKATTLQITDDEYIRQHPAISWVWRS